MTVHKKPQMSRNEALIIKTIKKPLKKARRKIKVIKQNGNLQEYQDHISHLLWLFGFLTVFGIITQYFFNHF